VLDEHGFDFLLRDGMAARAFADADLLAVGAAMLEQAAMDETVVDDNVGTGEKIAPAKGDQVRITGTGADKVDSTFRHGLGFAPRRIQRA
jgi:hypothetical protein